MIGWITSPMSWACWPSPLILKALFKQLASIPRQTHTSVNKKAKIVCTIGPASNTSEILGKMILAGMDVARLNFSHGSYEAHEATLLAVREAEKTWEKPIAVLQDLCGPKIRTGPMRDGAIRLLAGEVLVIQAEPVEGTADRISTITPEIIADLKVGDPVLLDDGLLELRVLKEGKDEVHCEVMTGGTLKSSKGINLPQTSLSLPSITEKDWQDLDWGLNHSIDYVALSFVRSAEDIWRIKKYIKAAGKRNLKVVAKIEKPEAVQNIREIIEVADAIMIARGDMGVELPAARVPRIQERIIQLCWEMNTPVITATQMLDSMTTNARPTRAEVTDVSMAIKQGTDAVMLSQETATGIDPVNVVRTMASIICEEERMISPVPRISRNWRRMRPSTLPCQWWPISAPPPLPCCSIRTAPSIRSSPNGAARCRFCW
jgi:pyruvate kinase